MLYTVNVRSLCVLFACRVFFLWIASSRLISLTSTCLWMWCVVKPSHVFICCTGQNGKPVLYYTRMYLFVLFHSASFFFRLFRVLCESPDIFSVLFISPSFEIFFSSSFFSFGHKRFCECVHSRSARLPRDMPLVGEQLAGQFGCGQPWVIAAHTLADDLYTFCVRFSFLLAILSYTFFIIIVFVLAI